MNVLSGGIEKKILRNVLSESKLYPDQLKLKISFVLLVTLREHLPQ